MKVIFFNRFFYPSATATSQLLSDLAFELAGHGHDVHVASSRMSPEAPREEAVHGVTVHRVATSDDTKHGLFAKAKAYLTYYAGARHAARRLISAGDVVIVKTDPPMLSSVIAEFAARRGARVIVWLQDLFPEVAKEYGIPGMGSVGGAFLRKTRNRSLQAADAVVAIGDLMAQRVAGLSCVPSNRIHVVHNWANGREITPMATEANPLRREWGLEGKFVLQYSGNLGRVHEFGTILDAAEALESDVDIRFLIIGGGPRLAEVQRRVARTGLSNVSFRPHQDRHRLAESLAVGDAHLCVLRPEFEGLVHPSKLYGIMAAGRASIFVGSRNGESARILLSSNCGCVVETGDARGLARAAVRLKESPPEREAMGRRAREAFDERYDVSIALAKWRTLIEGLA